LSLRQLEQAADGLDARSFVQWMRTFSAECSRRNLLSAAQLPDAIGPHTASLRPYIPPQVFLVGFDRISPQQSALLDELRTMGSTVTNLWLAPEEILSSQPDPSLLTAQTQEEELYAAACWIRQRLEQNPAQRIGVLAPSISILRPALERIFRRVLAPASLHLTNSSQRLPYEFSLGSPLQMLPQIRVALLLLRWLTQPLAWHEVSYLITAGQLGNTPLDASARLDAEVRTSLHSSEGSLSLDSLLHLLQRSRSAANAPCTHALRDALRLAQREAVIPQDPRKPAARTHAAWRAAADSILRAAQWTLLNPANSMEFQLLHRWQQALDALEAVDSVSPPAPFTGWLEALQSSAQRALFTQESQDAPVQILGVAESAGIPFDAIWFLNASAESWPARAPMQPWIPWLLQKQHQLPNADATADFDHACQVTRRVLASCAQTIFSFALEEVTQEIGPASRPNTAATRISPAVQDVLPHIAPVDAHTLFPNLDSWMIPATPAAIQQVAWEPAPPFTNASVRGGVRFLQLQAACPFRAFAELRLGAAPVVEPEPGMDVRTQGSLVHAVLRRFWTEVKTQSALRAMSTSERKSLLEQSVRAEQSAAQSHLPPEDFLLSLEAERITERLLAWLEVELQRPEFSVVACEESLSNASIGAIAFHARIDRIDQVGDGLALLDYKTGEISASACDGDRPDEPQLPAYAVLMQQAGLHGHPLHGAAFASLYAKKPRLKIVHALPQIFQTKTPSKGKRNSIVSDAEELAARVHAWQETLENLAEEFLAGSAPVQPKDLDATCKYCEQKLLCRIRETEQALNASEEDEDADDQDSTDEA
jgi:ATP-dependent helicase/nuclease subunit B